MRNSWIMSTTCALALAIACVPARAVEGLVTKASPNSVDQTIAKFEAAVKKRGFMVFTRLDHAAAAASVGQKMPRATVVVFGNPRLGTANIIANPTLAIDLPLKALIWEDANGKVFLSYNSAEYLHHQLYERHSAPYEQAATEKLGGAIDAMAAEAVK
ncbi:MAG: DUF302 domain-containing protein [Ramlibacter sp.]